MKKEIIYTVVFYKEPRSGKMPAREWFQELTKPEKKKLGHDLLVLQLTWPVGMPLVRNMKNGLWELRTSLSKKEARVFFAIKQKNIIVLHGIIKKTEKTPPRELELAMKRLNIFEQNEMEKK